MNETLKSISIDEVVVKALPGNHIGTCKREAIELAVSNWVTVRLIHNEVSYVVNKEKLDDLMR